MKIEVKIAETLKILKLSYLHPVQKLIIKRTLSLQKLNQIVILPTGYGKSICFQLPALIFTTPTLIVYPLRALARDQKRYLDNLGIPSVLIEGGQTKRFRNDLFQMIFQEKIKFILTNPETLQQEKIVEKLSTIHLAHFVVDEAHCISLWGKEFRPGYNLLGTLVKKLNVNRISAFTATADNQIVDDIRKSLFNSEPIKIVEINPDRENIYWLGYEYLSLRMTLTQLVNERQKPIIIFCRNRDVVRNIALHLSRTTFYSIKFYHAKLSLSEKKTIENWYRSCSDGILICTNAFGMGLNIENIRTVIHIEKPKLPADYIQEVGRVGRDGKPSQAIFLTRPIKNKALIQCRRKEFLQNFGWSNSVCSGCDVCKGFFEGEQSLNAIISFLLPWERKLNKAETKKLLFQRRYPFNNIQPQPYHPWNGWDDLACQEGWEILLNEDWIRFYPFMHWYSGLLFLPPDAKHRL